MAYLLDATRGDGFFLKPEPALVQALAMVSSWAMQQGFEPAAVSTFMQVADYYLVAQALSQKHMVVTHEIPSATTKRIKIPNVCVALGVKCMTPYEMLRNERARFVLGPRP